MKLNYVLGRGNGVYTYHDSAGNVVKLKTINAKIQPDLTFGWKQLNNDIYTCSASYIPFVLQDAIFAVRSTPCPITHLQ